MWLLIQPISLIDTSANNPEPTNDPIPEKKKNSPIIALCMDLGAAEYANSRPVLKDKKMLLEDLRNNISLFWFNVTGITDVYYFCIVIDLKLALDFRRQGAEGVNPYQFPVQIALWILLKVINICYVSTH